MAEKTVPTTTTEHEVQTTREASRFLRPPVDIYETDDSLVVLADLPGVDKDGVTVRVDDNVLSIRGKLATQANGEPVRQEYELLDFYREFQLGEQVDQEHIGAELKNGVLTVHLPKVAKAKPRQITVKAD